MITQADHARAWRMSLDLNPRVPWGRSSYQRPDQGHGGSA